MDPGNEPLVARHLGASPDDGTSPADILSLARELGLPAREKQLWRLSELRQALDAGEPVMAPIQRHGGGHWIVVKGHHAGELAIMDPARGEDGGDVELPDREFAAAWQDRDADGKWFIRYGIAFGEPAERLAEDEEEGQATREVASPGHDGAKAEELLRGAKAQGVAVLADLVSAALPRLLGRGRGALRANRLFNDRERQDLAAALAATNGTAELLGRARIKLRQRRATKHSEEPTPWDAFAGEEIKPFAPEKALDYFRGLVPELGIDPKRWGEDQRRQAFTMAEATDENLLARVQEVLSTWLEKGKGPPTSGTLEDGREVDFIPHRSAEPTEVQVMVDPARLDKAWQKDEGYYLPSEGTGRSEIVGRREGFLDFLRRGEAIQTPRVTLNDNVPGGVSFYDGRHRFAVLRDLGINQIPIMVPKDELATFSRDFGAEEIDPYKAMPGPAAVRQLLNQAGVSPRNPQYSEMVFRTNMMDSLNTGQEQEIAENAEAFPVWRWDGIADGRQRESHAVHFGRYFPASAAFSKVRDSVKGEYDGYNDRCTPTPVHHSEWKELQAAGARIADGW